MKDASATSYSEINTPEIKERFHHSSSSDTQAYESNVYLLDDDQSFTVQEGNTQTITVNEEEVTFENVDTQLSSSPSEVTFRIDGGLELGYMGEYFQVKGDCRYVRITDAFEDVSNDRFVEFTIYDACLSEPDGSYDLMAVAETSSGDFYHSQPIHFNFASVDGTNIPYIKSLTYDGQELSSLNSNSGLKVGDTVVVTVVKQESDPYNVSLVDRSSGQELFQGDVDKDGVLKYFRNTLVESVLGFYIDVAGFQSGDVAEIPLKLTPEQNEDVNFLNTVNDSYQVGIKVEEDIGVRNSVTYSVETSESAAAPVVESIEASKFCNSYKPITEFDAEQNIVSCIKVTASDSDTPASQLGVSLNLTHVYDNITYYETDSYSSYDSRNGNEYIFDTSNAQNYLGEFRESGAWKVTAKAEDGLNSDSLTRQWNVPWGDLAVEMVSPSSDITILNNESFSFDLKISCSGGPECVNQNESVTLYFDPLKQASTSFLQNLKSKVVRAFQ